MNQTSAIQRIKNCASDHVGSGVVGAVYCQDWYSGVSEFSKVGYGVFEGDV